MSWQRLALEVPLDRVSPDSSTLVEMHLGHAAFFQSVDGLGELLAGALFLDIFDGVEVSFDGEHERLGLGEPV